MIILLCMLLCGCDAVKNLKMVVDQSDAPREVAVDMAGLSVEVDPPQGIAILIDANHVATTSPYINRSIDPGMHTLTVRAMGYYPINVPVDLKKHAMLHVPVSLRSRPAQAWDNPSPRPAPRESTADGGPDEPPAPDEIPNLPANMAPLTIRVVAIPVGPVILDGVGFADKLLTINKVRGLLQIGDANLNYQVTDTGALELSPLPNDIGLWYRDGTRLNTPSFRFVRGLTRLRYVYDNGKQQDMVFKRT